MITFPPVLDTMRLRPRWVLWRYYTDNDGKRRKLPYDLNQLPGLSNEKRQERGQLPVKLGTLADALALWGRSSDAFAGMGYVPDINDSFACLDFDSLSTATRDALNLWNGCRTTTYCEFSPSGTGGHAVITLRPDAKKRLRGIRNIIPGMELYSNTGYFTATGKAISALPIADYSDRLINLADRLNLQPKEGGTTTVPTSLRQVADIEVARVVEKICNWRNGERFHNMHFGPWSEVSTWAQRGNHDGPSRSHLIMKYIGYLLAAKVDDDALIWAIARRSVLWGEYSKRENAETTFWQCVADVRANRSKPVVLAKPTFVDPVAASTQFDPHSN